MKRNARLGRVIAIRQFTLRGSPRKAVVVKLGIPRKDMQKGGDWLCPIQVRGLGDPTVKHIHGIDAFQALIMALECVRAHLEPRRGQLSWAAGEKGQTGFPRYVPDIFGQKFSMKVNKFIDQEISGFAKAAAKRHRVKL